MWFLPKIQYIWGSFVTTSNSKYEDLQLMSLDKTSIEKSRFFFLLNKILIVLKIDFKKIWNYIKIIKQKFVKISFNLKV